MDLQVQKVIGDEGRGASVVLYCKQVRAKRPFLSRWLSIIYPNPNPCTQKKGTFVSSQVDKLVDV
jgi:hypothetical protein